MYFIFWERTFRDLDLFTVIRLTGFYIMGRFALNGLTTTYANNEIIFPTKRRYKNLCNRSSETRKSFCFDSIKPEINISCIDHTILKGVSQTLRYLEIRTTHSS